MSDRRVKSEFSSMLARYKRCWQMGLFVRDILKVFGLAVVLLAVYCLLDFFLALSSISRLVVDYACLGGFGLLGLLWLSRVIRISDRDMAIRADKLLKSRRRSVLSGLELESELDVIASETKEMHEFLLKRCISRSFDELKSLRFRDYYPVKETVRQMKVLSLQMLVVVIMFFLNTAASKTILSRVFLPLRDVPPYSSYVFAVMPDQPKVVYGGSAEITVEITGGKLRSQVWLLTKHGGRQHKSACFQESGKVFAQRLEKVVNPIEFCFAVGKARSKWRKVELLLQPRIAVANVVVTPPKYTRLPKRQFFVGNEDFAVYRKSNIELAVTSNRPLLDGSITIRPKGGLAGEEVITGQKQGANSVVFEWTAKGNAELEIVIRDIQGTKNKDPFEVDQKIVADEPPQTIISEPAGFVMATPRVAIPLRGYSEDDLALSRMELIRTVVGYRDRIKRLGPESPVKRLDLDEVVDLKKLGAEPGQVLEFYLESGDMNPNLMGVSASSVVRIQVISEEEYAQSLRAKEKIEDFLLRYRIVADEIRKLRDALRELKEAAESEDKTDADVANAAKDAAKTAEEAAETLRKIAEDFPIYDMETQLAEFAGATAGMMNKAANALDGVAGKRDETGDLAKEMLKAMGDTDKKMQEQTANAEELENVYRVMECAGNFKSIYRRQAALVNRLQRFAKTTKAEDLRLLESLGKRQADIKKDLEKLVKDIKERVEKLGSDYEELYVSALEFADKIGELEIPDVMNNSALSAKNQDGKQALRFATLARDRLEQLMSECKGDAFGGMCQGKIKFRVPKDMQTTLQQMMQSMGAGMGGGMGQGGMGAGGDANDGYSMGGNSPVNTPMFGPSRLSIPGVGTGAHGRGGDSGRGKPSDMKVDETEQMRIETETFIEGGGLPVEEVPDKYRDAVKRYFSESDK